MEQPSSARMQEPLRASIAGPVVVADYRFRSPDAFASHVNAAADIDIGSRSFHRDDPSQPWREEDSGVARRWPAGWFRSYWGPGVAATVVGIEVVDGVASTEVAFVPPELSVWFRIWVGANDGLVRREQKRAEGHIMDHEWGDFGVPVDIRPPR